MIRFLYVISEFAFSSIVMTFLYTNIYIIYDFYKCLNSFIIFFIFKFSFHYLFIIKYNLALYLILKMFIFERFFFVLIDICSIVFFLKLNLHLIFKKPLIFFINVIIIILIFFCLLMLLSFSFSLIFL